MSDQELNTCHFSFEGVKFDFLIGASEKIITENVVATGAWEQNQLCLYRGYLPDNGVMVDIGANVGVNSIFAQKRIPTATIHAIEASQDNFAVLSRNVEGAGINAHFLAIADHDGKIRFAGSGTNAKISENGVEVPSAKLDTFACDLTHIDLLKIDVEGFTDVVLSGAAETLRKTRRAIVEFSIGDIQERFGGSVAVEEHFAQLLRSMAYPYVYYISRNDGLVKLDNASDLLEMLSIEHNVGDLLFSRQIEPSISFSGLLTRKIKTLMTHNHNLLVAVRRLDAKGS
ncbi:FkbM family methyltransferase [Agrobacterium rosae]|uniref:FkbM family methyltransferase n=1 Tax=Agrobacterium rosae TaxID=1972867 RepID=UPI002A1503AB|nr:FkbM family methyltransferase [Agrobacterium rosae]MDX8316901.1 FkbM family methyltransferase [Agrobacterium rosae]MDX8316926.1 FkbM family methyltransferase [Agrobacterium rosae]